MPTAVALSPAAAPVAVSLSTSRRILRRGAWCPDPDPVRPALAHALAPAVTRLRRIQRSLLAIRDLPTKESVSLVAHQIHLKQERAETQAEIASMNRSFGVPALQLEIFQ